MRNDFAFMLACWLISIVFERSDTCGSEYKSQKEFIMEDRITHFQIGENEATDIVNVEDLLMKLALAESVMNELANYIDEVDGNYGTSPDDAMPPNSWAICGAAQNLSAVSHALKCGCWGYRDAFNHD